jgi:hypothetical protein
MLLSNYALMQNHPIPRKIVLQKKGITLLEIVVHEVQFNPQWNQTPFYIRPPNGPKRMHP